MNEIKLANIIVQKRHEKGITQEELAEYIGVSKAAVSKWEKEQSYPDITLLPHLATFFNLSIDELLDYSPHLTREDTRKLYHRLSADITSKSFDEVMTECKAIVKKYFSCFPLLYQMAVLITNHYMLAGTQEQQDETLEEAKSLCERIILESCDALLSKDALDLECYICIALRKPEDVFALMGESLRMSTLPQDSLISQAFMLAGNSIKAQEITQCGMYQYLTSLLESTLNYISLSDDVFDTAETAFIKVTELIRIYDIEKLNINLAVQAYLLGANLYCKHGYLEKALDWLEKYANLCIKTFVPFKLRGDSFFTSIDKWLDSCEIGSSSPRDEKIVKQSMLQGLTAFPSFTALSDEMKFKRIVRRLTDFANAE